MRSRRSGSFAALLLVLLALTGAAPWDRRNVGHPHGFRHRAGVMLPADITPPEAVNPTLVGVTATTVTLTWVATGDDIGVGKASSYDIRYVVSPLEIEGDWGIATHVQGEIYPSVSGTVEVFTITGLTPSTSYQFGIVVNDEVPNASEVSAPVDATTSVGPDIIPPGDIANLAANSPTQTTIVLSWTSPGDDNTTGTATSYDVRYSTSAITSENFASATQFVQSVSPLAAGGSESLTVTGLTANTLYYFAVKTADEVLNTSGISNVVALPTLDIPPPVDVVPPAAVTNLSVAVGGSTSVLLAWFAPGDDGYSGQATSYDLRRSTSPITSGNFAAATAITGPVPGIAESTDTWFVTGLSGSTLYYFAIKSSDEVGNVSAISNIASYTTSPGADTTPPSAVTLSISNITSNSVNVDWSAVGDDGATGMASSYDLRRSTSVINAGNFASATPVTPMPSPGFTGTAQTKRVASLSANTTYYFAMKVSDEIPNVSALSNVVSATTLNTPDTTPPATISSLSVASLSPTSVTLSWSAPGDDGVVGTATTYDLRYSTSPITEFSFFSSSQATTEPAPELAGTVQGCTISGLSASTTYYFCLIAQDEVPNSSGLSNLVSAATSLPADTTPPAMVESLTLTTSTANSLDFRWSATGDDDYVGTATSYDIRYSTSSSTLSTWTSATQATLEPTPLASGTVQSYTITGLPSGTTYYIGIKALDEVGNTSPLSNVLTAQTLGEATPPATITDLTRTDRSGNSISLAWTEVGDDGLSGIAASHSIRYSTSPIVTLGRVPNVSNGATWGPNNSPYTESSFAQAVGGWWIGGPLSTQPYQPFDAATKLLGQPHSILHVFQAGSYPLTPGYAQCLSAVLGGTYQWTTINGDWQNPNVVVDPSIPLGSFGYPMAPGAITNGIASRVFSNVTVYVNLSTTAQNNTAPGGVLQPSGYRIVGTPGASTKASGTFPQYGGWFTGNLTVTNINALKEWTDIGLAEANLNGPRDSHTDIPALPKDRVLFLRAAADHPIRVSAQLNGFNIFVSAVTHQPSAYYPMQVKMYHKANALNAWIYAADGVTPHEVIALGVGVRYIDITNTAFRNWMADYTDSMMVATGVDYLFMDQIESSLAAEKGFAPGALWPTDAAWTSGWQAFFARMQTSLPAPTVVAGPAPGIPGTLQSHTVAGLSNQTRYFFSMTTSDEAANVSGLSNVATDSTLVVDSTPPATTSTLAASAPTQSTITVSWTSPGDDGTSGTAASYDLRYSTSTINAGNFASASLVPNEPTPAVAGTSQSVVVSGLLAGTQYFFALKTADSDGNVSGLSNVPDATTSPAVGVSTVYTVFNQYCTDNFGALTEPLVYTTFGALPALVPAGDWVYPSRNSASVAFQTTLPCMTRVLYGTTTTYSDSTALPDRPYYNHLHRITGLTASTLYHYKLVGTDENGRRVVSADRTFTTGAFSGAIPVPGALAGPPYVLNTTGATYLLTQDITSTTRAISIQAANITLDLNGFTATYDTGTPLVAGGQGESNVYLYSDVSTSGIHSFSWNLPGTMRILNGTILQGANNGTGSINNGDGVGFNPICIASTTGSIEVAGITCKWAGNDVSGIYFNEGSPNIHHNELVDSGTVTTNRSQGTQAIFSASLGSVNGIHHNLLKRFRNQGIMHKYGGSGPIYDNELYGDSYVTNSYCIGPAPFIHGNKIFGTGYHSVGIGFLRDTAAAPFTVYAHDNFIFMQGEAPSLRDTEYGMDASVVGMRVTQYTGATVPYDNYLYANNTIIVKGRNGTLNVRGTQFASDPFINNLQFNNNVVKCEVQDTDTRGACVIGEGDGYNLSGTELPVYYNGNTFISNDVHVRFGERYGSGGNHQFRNCVFNKLGSRAQFVPVRIGYGDFASYRNRFIDSSLGGGVALAPALWQGGVDFSNPNNRESGVDNAPAGRRDYSVGHSWYITALGNGGLPLQNVVLNVTDSRGASYTTTTNSSGVARLELISNSYEALAGIGTPTSYTHTGHQISTAGYAAHVITGGEFSISNNPGSPTTVQF